jgi:hypothetical protein
MSDSRRPFIGGALAPVKPTMQPQSMMLPNTHNATASSRGATPQLHGMHAGMQQSAGITPAATLALHLQQQRAKSLQQAQAQPYTSTAAASSRGDTTHAFSVAKKPRIVGPSTPAQQHAQHVAMALQQQSRAPPGGGGTAPPQTAGNMIIQQAAQKKAAAAAAAAAAHHVQRAGAHMQSAYGIQSQHHGQHSSHAGMGGVPTTAHGIMPNTRPPGLVGANGVSNSNHGMHHHHHQADASRLQQQLQQQHPQHSGPAPSQAAAQLTKPLILGLPTVIGTANSFPTPNVNLGGASMRPGTHMPVGAQIASPHGGSYARHKGVAPPPSVFPSYTAESLSQGAATAAHMVQVAQLGKRRYGT